MKREDFTFVKDQLLIKVNDILDGKNDDYASKEDMFKNFREMGDMNYLMSKEDVALFFITGKICRIRNLLGREAVNESITDSAIDLIAYGILLYAMLEENKYD